MKIKLISQSDISGGAARATYRLHKALLANNIESEMVVRKSDEDTFSNQGNNKFIHKTLTQLREKLGAATFLLQKSSNTNLRTGNWLPSNWSKKINASNADVINLHWVGGETLSIEDIGRISKPLIWTLHDMWPFCGAEHYTSDDANSRWRHGYNRTNRSPTDKGLDLDRLVWARKCNAWKIKMHIIAPSNWLADCARNSALFRNCNISTIPNVLDTNTFQPLPRETCRKILGLPQDRKIILFGAMNGGKDSRKGFDLLIEALQLAGPHLSAPPLCVVFGQRTPLDSPNIPFETRWMGHIHDDYTLALLYNSATIMIVPSRQENLPQTATEAQSCGCPVVAFNCTGLPDAVQHKSTGYLAKAFDTADMAAGITWLLENEVQRVSLSQAARERAVNSWSPSIVTPQYLKVFQQAIDSNKVS
ncbi:glycosyltransferase family 4 protein [Cellvibrio sp.]|uniref:glycosyltransferase family 4 protein n=1 Tax=Cellvibrio sp. TaxID=1965322 RepID=UPI0039648A4C